MCRRAVSRHHSVNTFSLDVSVSNGWTLRETPFPLIRVQRSSICAARSHLVVD